MANINLIIKGDGDLRLSKSNTGNVQIPYQLDNYGLLLQHCAQAIPSEWRTKIAKLYSIERRAINARRDLMAEYKVTLSGILPKYIEEFKDKYPELMV